MSTTIPSPDLLLDYKKAARHILRTAMDLCKAKSGSLMLLNPNTGQLDMEVVYGLRIKPGEIRLNMGQGITGWVASTGRSLRVGDVGKDKRYLPICKNVVSEMAVPLEVEGNVVGVIDLGSKKRNAFSQKNEDALLGFAKEAVEWLSAVWEVEHLRNKARQLESLVNMGQTILSQDVLSKVLSRVASEACHLMKASLCSIMLVNEDGTELELKAWHGASPEYVSRPNLQVADSLVGVVVRRQKPLAMLNVQESHRYRHTELARREGLVSLLSVPLSFEGKAMGVLSVYTLRAHRFSNDEIRLLEAMAGLSSVVIAKARIFEGVVRAEERLKEAEKLSALGWLAAEVAHEIRNPLTVMQMLFHSLTEGMPLDDSGKKDVQLIQEKMKHMNRIVEQVLAFAKSSEPYMERVDVNAMMDDLALLTRHKLAEQKIELKSKLEPGLPPIMGDRPQIEQAMLNLVLNACNAMPEGGTLTLSASSRKVSQQCHVVLGVRDTGRGISEGFEKNMFTPFMSAHKGGTGIGLALVQKTVEHHRGKIRVSSKLGKGTLISVSIPATDFPEEEEGEE